MGGGGGGGGLIRSIAKKKGYHCKCLQPELIDTEKVKENNTFNRFHQEITPCPYLTVMRVHYFIFNFLV